jgi:SAM-dependent methyltransferase
MVELYLSDLSLTGKERVVEIGCGTGAISRLIAISVPGAEIVGTDPSSILLDKARQLSRDLANVTFEEADGRHLPFPDSSFDVAILHRVLCHIPGPERALGEAARVLRPGGRVVVFDGDYATITLATADADPLQTCVQAFVPAYINDPWIVRRLTSLVTTAGFVEPRLRSHGFVQVHDPDYMLTIADRGADTLTATGVIGRPLADALKAEARRRVVNGTFFGHVAYASHTAHKPSN